MDNGTGVETYRRLDEDDDVAITAQQQMLRDLGDKLDDVRGFVSDMTAGQAVLTGKVDVLASQLGAAERVNDLRLSKLERAEERANQRAWIERMIYAALGATLGAGGYDLLHRTFHLGS